MGNALKGYNLSARGATLFDSRERNTSPEGAQQ